MKKRLLAGLAIFGLVFAAGCGTGQTTPGTAGNDNAGNTSSAQAETEAVTPTVTPETNTVAGTEIPTQDQTSGQTGGQSSAGAAAGDIGEEVARATAVEHAGLTEGDVTFIMVQKDREDGRTVYDVEFYYNNTEYDYEIDAATGEIVSYDRDIENYDVQAQMQQAGNVISLDQAKEAALNAAGLNAGNVTWVKEKLDWDDGRAVYELECISGELEYDFEINAADGTVLEQDRDSIYD